MGPSKPKSWWFPTRRRGPGGMGGSPSRPSLRVSSAARETKTGEKRRRICCSQASKGEAGAGSMRGGRAAARGCDSGDWARSAGRMPARSSSSRRFSALVSSSAAWAASGNTLRTAAGRARCSLAVSTTEGSTRSRAPARRSVREAHGSEAGGALCKEDSTKRTPSESASSRLSRVSGGRMAARDDPMPSKAAGERGESSGLSSRPRSGANQKGLPKSGVTIAGAES
mmetsp:Transcript_6387/g.13944  ORF Transcript_6387/g.13944 Transcript_6387/m.13944 type:complete len:227 (-) Transcript_6387:600-1280(-)